MAEKKKKISKLQIFLAVVCVLCALGILKIVWILTARPNIKINYIKLLNEITKPADYDPEKNALNDYKKALEYYTEKTGLSLLKQSWPGDFNPEDLEKVKKVLAENETALQYFIPAAGKPYYWLQGPEETNRKIWEVTDPYTSQVRSLSINLNWRAKIQAFKNNPADAFGDILTSIKIGEQLSNCKRMLAQATGESIKRMAVRDCFIILANSRIDANTLTDFQQKLDSFVYKEQTPRFIEERRIFMLDVIQRVFTDDGRGNGNVIPLEFRKLLKAIGFHYSPKTAPRPGPSKKNTPDLSLPSEIARNFISGLASENLRLYSLVLYGPDRKKTTRKLDELINQYVVLQNLTPWQLHSRAGIEEKKVEEILKSCPLLNNILLPAVFFERPYRLKACESALITTIALLRYKAANGQFPDNLRQLINAGLIKELPKDPYSDGPLVYKKTGDNFFLYSIGPDFIDDGGQAAFDDFGQAAWWPDKGDTVFWPIEKKGENK
jgi:hypothetical protein